MKKLSLMALTVLLVAGLGVAGEKEVGTWVERDHHAVALHADHMMFIGDEGGEKFNLSDLADGESRTFGEGDKQITATRVGDDVTVIREARGDEKALEIKCSAEQDTCQVITFEEDPEKVMIVIQKTRECVNGVGDCAGDIDVTVDHLGGLEGHNVHAIVKKVICDDDGNCETTEDVHGGPGGNIEVIADFVGAAPGGHGGKVMIMTDDKMGQAMLRCPEGDSSIHVGLEEADDTFLCPKHSVPMEKVEAQHFIRKMRIEKDD